MMHAMVGQIEAALARPSVRLVFPTEILAEFWAQKTVDAGTCPAVRLGRFMSWDTCLRHLSGVDPNRKPADSLARRVFAAGILQENSRRPMLQYLVPPEQAERYRPFISSVAAAAKTVFDPALLPDSERVSLHGADPVASGERESDAERRRPTRGSLAAGAAPLPAAALEDLLLLQSRYREFLDRTGLYEPAALESVVNSRVHADPDLRLALGLPPNAPPLNFSCLVFFPELIAAIARLLSRETGEETLLHPALAIVPTPLPDSSRIPELQVFEHTGHELSHLVFRIEGLLDRGVDPTEIAVTLGDYDLHLPELKAAADLRSIPLRFRRGDPIGREPVAGVFRAVVQTAAEQFSLGSLKRFLLNRAIPWRDRQRGERLVRLGLKLSCARGSRDPGRDLWELRLQRAAESDALEYYRGLKRSILAVTDARDPQVCYQELMQFWNSFIDPDGWSSSDGSVALQAAGSGHPAAMERLPKAGPGRRVLPGGEGEPGFGQQTISFCLDSLRRAVHLFNRAGIADIPGCCRFWVDSLDALWYVAQRREPGVSVYDYGMSAGIDPPFHLAVGLSQNAVRHVEFPFPFLREIDREPLARLERDTSEAILRITSISGELVESSCSRRGYGGAQLPAGWFIEIGRYREQEPDDDGDLYLAEQRYWSDPAAAAADPAPRVHLPQIQGFSYARATGFDRMILRLQTDPLPEGPHRALLLNMVPSAAQSGRMVISPTALDSFSDCPFNWLIERILKIERDEGILVPLDPRVVGTMAHRAARAYYEMLEEEEGPISASSDSRCAELMSSAIDASMQQLRRRADAPVEPAADWLEQYLKTSLPQLIAADMKLLAGWRTGFLEKRFSWDRGGGPILEGQVDRIALREDRVAGRSRPEYAVIDFKKRGMVRVSSFSVDSSRPDSCQLPMYVHLLMNASAEGQPGPEFDQVAFALYFDMSRGTYTRILDDRQEKRDGFTRVMELTLQAAEAMERRIAAGDLRTEADRKTCSACRSRSICRERYAVRQEGRHVG